MDHSKFTDVMDAITQSPHAEFKLIYDLITNNILDIHQQIRVVSWLSWLEHCGVVLFSDGTSSIIITPDSSSLFKPIISVTDTWEEAWIELFELDTKFNVDVVYVGSNPYIRNIYNLSH